MSFIVRMLKKKIFVGRLRIIPGLMKFTLREWLFYPVKGVFGLNIVTRKELFNNSNSEKYHILEFGSEESIVVRDSFNGLDGVSTILQSHYGSINLSKPFIVEVANAKLVGSAAIGFDEDGNMLSEAFPTPCFQGNLKKYLPIRTFFLNKLPSIGVSPIDTACSLVSFRSKNYYHWITDCLIRIEGLKYYEQKTNEKPILIIDSNPPKWQVESLRLLGYEPHDCIHWNGLGIKLKKLVVPSIRLQQRLPSPTACRWLRQRLLSNLPDLDNKNSSFSSRIYISRPKTAGRQILNEDEVLEALIPLGFVAYTPENMSFSDQVRLFSQAEIVVAAHGAGLTNILFAQNLKVIEIFGSVGTASYFVISKAMGFDYRYLTFNPEHETQYSEKFKGIMVDVTQLQALVTEMLDVYSDRKPRENAA